MDETPYRSPARRGWLRGHCRRRLRFHHHHSYQEISEITGLSVGNVGFLLNAAMRNLRGKMDRDDKDEKIIYLKKGVA